jgi:tetratricopeptide (TPR) repeat protein/TolB-like protein/tRNA A-37 threonylcarbamoyl transferase component Bud32
VTDRTVLHYRLGDRLGTGASGDVYLAEDLRLHRPVALKMLRSEAEDDAEAAGRLMREARVASALSHPNIAVVYEVGEVEHEGRRRGFIAMEHVRGRTLQDRLREGPLPAPETLAVTRQVAEALLEAHGRGIIHRDVKPGNVMVNERGLVKVLDFGLAKFAPPTAEGAATWSGRHGALEGGGAILGTLAYMSPEQARGGDVDVRSDVYSLGGLLYEMLSGRPPFTGSNAVELLEALLRDEPAPLPADTPLGDALRSLCLRLLAKDRARRPADMREVLRLLDEAAAGRLLREAPKAGDEVAIMNFANLTRNAEHDWLGTGIAETLIVGLSAQPGFCAVSRERTVEVLRKLGGLPESDDPAVAVRLGIEIGARFVVSGGYQILGEQVRVTARILEIPSGQTSVTLKVDGTRASIFDLQDRLVAEVGAGLRGQLPTTPSRGDETKSLEAYEAFSKGMLNLREESPESLDRAIVFFEQAIALDPDYARAHMHLGAALDWKGEYLGLPGLTERAMVSLDRALELRPDHGEAWRHKGSALITLGRDEEALAAFERALALNPLDAWAYSGVGRVHFVLRGEFAKAMAAYELALSLNPQGGWSALQLAHCAALVRDFAKAEASARRAIELQQGFLSGRIGIVIVGAWVRLGQVFALKGRHAEAIQEYEKELEFLKGVDHALRARSFIELHQRRGESRLQVGDAEGGGRDLDLALETFERRLRNGADDPMTRYYAACAHALRGDKDAALVDLEKAAEKRLRLTVARGRIEPALESLHTEPRFQALLARVPTGGTAAEVRALESPEGRPRD